MNHIAEAVRAYLQEETGVHAVCEGAKHTGEYPLIAVNIAENGTVLTSGGKLCEHDYAVCVKCAVNRERTGETAALAALVPVLLRGIPMTLMESEKTVKRVLSPLGIRTEGDELSFHLKLSVPVPPKGGGAADADRMQTLHFDT